MQGLTENTYTALKIHNEQRLTRIPDTSPSILVFTPASNHLKTLIQVLIVPLKRGMLRNEK